MLNRHVTLWAGTLVVFLFVLATVSASINAIRARRI
jgi:hypothetical protein